MPLKAPVPGMMWVNSDVIKPDALARNDFDKWYCDEHIPEVMTKSGIRSANRYDHMINGPSGPRRLGFLTIYEMPDINFMETEEFRGLEGQSPGPNQNTIFVNAEFDTRSYELAQTDEAKGKENLGPAPFLLSAALKHTSDSAMDEWYREEHVRLVSQTKGYRRTRRYKLASRSVLSAFERSFPEAPVWLAIHEFDGSCVPWDQLALTDETEWAKKILPGILEADFGCFRLKRVYDKKSKARL